jgi:6-phosphogluconolactonase (cycloisomerase 2 family)
MKFRLFVSLLIVVTLGISSGCLSTSNSTASSGSSLLFVTTLGNTALSSFGIDLDNGTIATTGGTAPSGTNPIAMALAPGGATAFVVNNAGSAANGTVSAFSLGSDGSVKAAGTPQAVGSIPVALALDPAGHFLFVVNQGTPVDSTTGTISVFSVQTTSLTAVTGSPFPVLPNPSATAAGPAALAVTPDGKFLYVANRFNSTVSVFSIDSSGALTLVGVPAVTGTNPTALTVTPDGAFLYVANFGSNNISAFTVCDKVVTSCQNPSSPDGTLTQASGSPFSSGIGPIALTTSPPVTYLNTGNPLAYLYVADQNGNEISEYQISTVTGSLTPLSNATISTGPSPVSIVSRFGNTTGNTTTDYVYVSNQAGGSISSYSFNAADGLLVQVGSPTTSAAGQPTALAIE